MNSFYTKASAAPLFLGLVSHQVLFLRFLICSGWCFTIQAFLTFSRACVPLKSEVVTYWDFPLKSVCHTSLRVLHKVDSWIVNPQKLSCRLSRAFTQVKNPVFWGVWLKVKSVHWKVWGGLLKGVGRERHPSHHVCGGVWHSKHTLYGRMAGFHNKKAERLKETALADKIDGRKEGDYFKYLFLK